MTAPKWTGKVVGDMHVYHITYQEMAKKLGWSRQYLWMILSGQRQTAGSKEKIIQALNELKKEGGYN